MEISGTTTIVTGGASGIGRATAEALLARGARVVIWDSADALEEVAAEIGAEARRVDVLDSAQVREAANADPDASALVTCAGIVMAHGSFTSLWNISDEGWNEVMDINLRGTFLALREVSRNMVERGIKGRIVTIASTSGAVPDPEQTVYCVSKAGVIMLTKTAAFDLAPHGVLVNCISPGPTRTSMGAKVGHGDPALEKIIMRVPANRWCAPEEVANAVLFMVDNNWTTGENMFFDGGYQLSGPFYWDRYRDEHPYEASPS